MPGSHCSELATITHSKKLSSTPNNGQQLIDGVVMSVECKKTDGQLVCDTGEEYTLGILLFASGVLILSVLASLVAFMWHGLRQASVDAYSRHVKAIARHLSGRMRSGARLLANPVLSRLPSRHNTRVELLNTATQYTPTQTQRLLPQIEIGYSCSDGKLHDSCTTTPMMPRVTTSASGFGCNRYRTKKEDSTVMLDTTDINHIQLHNNSVLCNPSVVQSMEDSQICWVDTEIHATGDEVFL